MPIVETLLTPLNQGQIPRGWRHIPGRYQKSWAYQDAEERYFLGTFSVPTISAHSSDLLYALEVGDVARPDLISYKVYKHPGYYWVILWLNNISDPFEGMYPGMMLRLPTLQRLAEYGIRA